MFLFGLWCSQLDYDAHSPAFLDLFIYLLFWIYLGTFGKILKRGDGDSQSRGSSKNIENEGPPANYDLWNIFWQILIIAIPLDDMRSFLADIRTSIKWQHTDVFVFQNRCFFHGIYRFGLRFMMINEVVYLQMFSATETKEGDWENALIKKKIFK